VVLLSATLSGCGSTINEPVEQSHRNHSKLDNIVLSVVSFSPNVLDGKFRTDCSMLTKLSDTITQTSHNHRVRINSVASYANHQYHLNVTYIDVVPHKWRLFSLRPSSNATFTATLYLGSEELHKTTETVSSGASFGACDRLEKIALANGRYISSWVSKVLK